MGLIKQKNNEDYLRKILDGSKQNQWNRIIFYELSLTKNGREFLADFLHLFNKRQRD